MYIFDMLHNTEPLRLLKYKLFNICQ